MEELQRDLGRLEGKVDGLATLVTDLKTTLDKRDVERNARINKHDERITSLEKKVWYLSGASAIVGMIIAKVDWLGLLPR